MIKVSLILPSLNVKKYIRKCVMSAQEQTLKDLEILCIDAGSDDGTWEILKKLAAKDERIRLIRSEMKSYGYQVNLGLRLARGDYIGILETDDFVEPQMYETLYEAVVRERLDVVKAGFYFHSSRKGQEEDRKRMAFEALRPAGYKEVIEDPAHLYALFPEDSMIWTGLYRRQFLLSRQIRCSETPGAAFQDIGFVLQTLYLAQRVMYLPECFYHYRIDRKEASVYSIRVLSYCHVEFSRSRQILLACGVDDLRGYYIRLAGAFLHEYKKVLRAVKYNTEDPILTETMEWFWETLSEGMEDGWIREEDLRGNAWEEISLFVRDRTAFGEQMKRLRSKAPSIERGAIEC